MGNNQLWWWSIQRDTSDACFTSWDFIFWKTTIVFELKPICYNLKIQFPKFVLFIFQNNFFYLLGKNSLFTRTRVTAERCKLCFMNVASFYDCFCINGSLPGFDRTLAVQQRCFRSSAKGPPKFRHRLYRSRLLGGLDPRKDMYWGSKKWRTPQ